MKYFLSGGDLARGLGVSLLVSSLFLGSGAAGGDWPQWRGPLRDGHAAMNEAGLQSLPAELKVKWRLEIGGGFSSPVVQSGKLVYLDSREGSEVAHLVEVESGREIWQVPYAESFGDEWGEGPRSTPLMDGEQIYVQSCTGEFRCLNLKDGKTIWGTSFEKDFGVHFLGNKSNEGTATRRGNSGSPVLEGKRLFLPVGKPEGGTMVCFDKLTGKVIWKGGEDEAAYSSPMIGTLAGVHQVVYLAADSVMGLDFETGRQLWRVPLRTNAKRHAATPIIFGDEVLVNSHSFGLLCFHLTREGDLLSAREKWVNRELKINVSTPAMLGHYLYSQGELNSKNFVCVDALTGKTQWKATGFGNIEASTMVVGQNLLVQTDKGELVLVAGNPEKFVELGRMQDSGATWSHPAYSDGRLFVREGTKSGFKLTCFERLSAKP